jgi:hypothetical protein
MMVSLIMCILSFFLILKGKYTEASLRSSASRFLTFTGSSSEAELVIIYFVCSHDESYSIIGGDSSSLQLKFLTLVHLSSSALIFFDSSGVFLIDSCVIKSIAG